MIGKRIPQLPVAPTVGADDLLVIEQDGRTKSTTAGDMVGGVVIPIITDFVEEIVEEQAQDANYLLNAAGSVERTIRAKLGDVVSVKDFGAIGNGVADDTAAIQTAFTTAASIGKRIHFPAGVYLCSTTVVITGSDWEITGAGNAATRWVMTTDNDHLQINCETTASYRGAIRNMELQCTAATYTNAWGIHVVTDPLSVGTDYLTLRSWLFENLRFRGVYHGIAFDDMGKIDNGDAVFANGNGGFNRIINIDVPQYTRYPYQVVVFKGATGAHNIIWGGQYRSTNCGVSIGDGTWAIGDFEIGGIHFVTGDWAVRANGPATAGYYNRNLTIIACQFDVLNVGTYFIDRMDDFRVYGNASLRGVGPSVTNQGTDYTIDDRGTWTLSGIYVPKITSLLDRVELRGSASGGTPTILPYGTSATKALGLAGKGAAGVLAPTNYANHLHLVGSAAAGGFAQIVTFGTDTNIRLVLDGKGTSGVQLSSSVTRPVGFFGSSGQAKQTLTGAKGGNAALTNLITLLAGHGLLTDSTT